MSTSPRKTRNGGVVIPNSPKWHQRLAAFILVVFARAVALTLRLKTTDRFGFDRTPKQPAIFCFWHNRLALMPIVGQNAINKKWSGSRFAALVSASKDGAFLAAIVEACCIQPVRGSSSRRGAQALLELTSWAERGYHLAITPDGPRGPRYQVQEGVLFLAQVTGLPIVPLSYSTDWKLVLKSWDRFQIPLPFSRGDIVFGEPLHVAAEATDAERETARQELENRLLQLTLEHTS
jgi:lysophospholipid acyltransferase (LPLAT)-like uncharacterized protein